MVAPPRTLSDDEEQGLGCAPSYRICLESDSGEPGDQVRFSCFFVFFFKQESIESAQDFDLQFSRPRGKGPETTPKQLHQRKSGLHQTEGEFLLNACSDKLRCVSRIVLSTFFTGVTMSSGTPKTIFRGRWTFSKPNFIAANNEAVRRPHAEFFSNLTHVIKYLGSSQLRDDRTCPSLRRGEPGTSSRSSRTIFSELELLSRPLSGGKYFPSFLFRSLPSPYTARINTECLDLNN